MPIVVKRRGEIQFTQFRTQRGSIPELNRSMTNRIATMSKKVAISGHHGSNEKGHIVRTESWLWLEECGKYVAGTSVAAGKNEFKCFEFLCDQSYLVSHSMLVVMVVKIIPV